MSFPDVVEVTDQEISLAHLSSVQKQYYSSLALRLTDIYRASGQRRVIISLAGPSGSGKSVVAEILNQLFSQNKSKFTFYPVELDAFHFSNNELNAVGIQEYKGRYDTYNTALLTQKLQQFLAGEHVMFPKYSRKFHEPIENGFEVEADNALLFLVGLWIQRDSVEWAEVRSYVHTTFMIDGPESALKRNTIDRHIRGGRGEREAETFYQNSDAINRVEVTNNSIAANESLIYFEDINRLA